MKTSISWAFATIYLVLATGVTAELLQEKNYDRLNSDLTPMGAERAGNAEGTIPAWDGGLTVAPENWHPEQGYPDIFADDPILFTITKENMTQYREQLSDGLKALLENYDSFKIPVYRTRRTFANPEFVYQATRDNAGKARVDGDGLASYQQPGVPFPIPASAQEVIFNHLNGWIGGYEGCTDWMPIFPNGDYYRVGWCSKLIQSSEMDNIQTPNDSVYFIGRYDAPGSLVGTVYLVHDVFNSEVSKRRAWIYNSGARRVRRAPDLAYDNIADGSEGMATIDDAAGFNGAIDRYHWKLLGKREMYIPYNGYKLGDPSLTYDRMIEGTQLKSELLRFELHRVWVIEATRKPDVSHIYNRRVFYIDEDSWKVTLTEAYDNRGMLWRTAILPLLQLYDVPIMVQRASMFHDLINGTTLLYGLDNEREKPSMKWHSKGRLIDFRSSSIKKQR
ncbi:MAG: DUF1329 domain-containing protein [Porticoccaceae bacterium]|nr:DUF1329 domain-containing protein [Pseudomonadales bacterium]MCP5172226.1 DUF1329 domain-containing protein [Pseudomonadales bacterium]